MSSLWNRGQAALRSMFSSALGTGGERGRYLVGEVTDLENGQMKEVAVEVPGKNYKVLLSKIQGQFYATSHLCTHYKARLVTGTITSDGRVVCPWHAACFNVKTGDIEEAPAIQALQRFDVQVEGDQVFILADPAQFERPSRPACVDFAGRDADTSEVYVIVGGGAAGAVAAESIRLAGFEGRVVMISKEPYLPIDRIKLSKMLDVQPQNILLYEPAYLDKIRVEVLTGKGVVGLDAVKSKITLEDGTEMVYDKILIATGGEPRKLPIPGADLGNVFVIRSITDSQQILAAVKTFEKPRVVVIGASFIGMEAASMLCKASQSVTVVGVEAVPLERVLGPKVGAVFQRLHEKNGVRFVLGASLKSLQAAEDQPESVAAVELGSGEKIAADIVIMGVGVRPQTDFLRKAIPMEQDGSLLVDEHMRVAGSENIFAAGDIAKFTYFGTGQPVRIEHWDVAQQQGRIAGHNMASSEGALRKYHSVPFFFTMQFGKSVRYAGTAHGGYDEVEIQGDLESDSPSFAAYYIKQGTITAVATMGRDPLAVHCSELFLQDRMIALADLRAGKSPLEIKA